MNQLPDGSGFFIGSFPLPKDHWLYAPRPDGWDNERDTSTDQPHPILDHSKRQEVIAAVRYAVRAATMCGTDMDFDPDALVQNAVVALCGFYPSALARSPSPDFLPAPVLNEEAKRTESDSEQQTKEGDDA